jgi:hypothetical protein
MGRTVSYVLHRLEALRTTNRRELQRTSALWRKGTLSCSRQRDLYFQTLETRRRSDGQTELVAVRRLETGSHTRCEYTWAARPFYQISPTCVSPGRVLPT